VVFVALLTLIAASLFAAPAAARGRIVGGLVAIRSPADGALASAGRARLVVRAPAHARRFRVTLDGRDVSGRFKRRGRLRVARVAGLRAGPHHLFADARDARGREGYARRRFVVGRRARGLLTLRRLRARQPAAPVMVGYRARRRPLRVFARLNGRRIDRVFGGRPWRAARVALSATHGLRPGRNRLTIRVHLLDGRYDVERRVFTVSRARPLAGAGRDRLGRVGRLVRFGGGASRPAAHGRPPSARRRGERLRYRWRLVLRPRGSHAALRRVRSAHPTLAPDRPGRYRASLVVTDRGRGRASATASSGARSAPDTVEANVQPDWGPIGGAVNLSGTGISIGGQTYQQGPGDVQVVVVERDAPATLVSQETYDADPDGVQALQDSLESLAQPSGANTAPYEYLVFIRAIAPLGESLFEDPSTASTFTQAIGEVGAQVCGATVQPPCLPAAALSEVNSSLSVIGVPGSAKGSAWVAPSLIQGWLQTDQSGMDYTFVPAAHVPFKTQTSPTQASVTVGGRTVTSGSLGAAPAGLFVVVYDAYDLDVVDQATLPLGAAGGAEAAHDFLAPLLQAGTAGLLVAVQSIGALDPVALAAADEGWGQLAQDIESLGCSADVFLRLNGGPYALLGGTRLEGGQGAETTPSIPVTPVGFQQQGGPGLPGTLSGMLSRQPTGASSPTAPTRPTRPTTPCWPSRTIPRPRGRSPTPATRPRTPGSPISSTPGTT